MWNCIACMAEKEIMIHLRWAGVWDTVHGIGWHPWVFIFEEEQWTWIYENKNTPSEPSLVLFVIERKKNRTWNLTLIELSRLMTTIIHYWSLIFDQQATIKKRTIVAFQETPWANQCFGWYIVSWTLLWPRSDRISQPWNFWSEQCATNRNVPGVGLSLTFRPRRNKIFTK